MPPKSVRLDGLGKSYGATTAVDGVTLTVEAGEVFCLLGPSGCGKTTTLRMIGGLTDPSAGTVLLDGTDVTDRPSADRDTATVFQDWALFPRQTALQNVAFGPKMAGADRQTRRETAREMLATVDMADHADQYPDELSGGQKQRVALARSLAVNPGVLLLDEPLSNLDKRLRQEMQRELTAIHETVSTTMIHVTHNQNEAFTLGDRIGIMRDGELVQVGEPRAVYQRPATQFVEEFLGEVTVVEGPVVDGVVETPLADLPLPAGITDPVDPVAVSLRPSSLTLSVVEPRADQPVTDGAGVAVTGTVSDVLYRGSTVQYAVDTGAGVEPFVEYSAREDPALDPGTAVTLGLDPAALHYFDAEGERL